MAVDAGNAAVDAAAAAVEDAVASVQRRDRAASSHAPRRSCLGQRLERPGWRASWFS